MATAFVPPNQMRYLRACMVCSIVQTFTRFREQGCPNCDGFLHLAGSQETVENCTSPVFEGVITLSDPSRSWVAKWQRLDKCHPGMYAIKVSGQLPDDVKTMLEEENVPYVPRDGGEAEVDQ